MGGKITMKDKLPRILISAPVFVEHALEPVVEAEVKLKSHFFAVWGSHPLRDAASTRFHVKVVRVTCTR